MQGTRGGLASARMKIFCLHHVTSPFGADLAPDWRQIPPRRVCVRRPYDSGHFILLFVVEAPA
eukprot:6964168-Alexandrium_andersonii.AAC.1